MKKSNLSHQTHSLRILAILCLLSSYLWIAPSQVHASPALTVEIVSSPYATVDSNGQPGELDGEIPEVFVIEAVITNTGGTTEDVVVHLDFNSDNDWTLLGDEDPDRIVDDLAPDTAYPVYWLARYPQVLPPDINATHQYTVTAALAEDPADSVAASATVETRETESTASQAMTYATAEVVVGVAFTVTTGFDLGTNPYGAVFSPVGNPDFEPSAYQLIASEVRFYNNAGTWEEIVPDRLYFPTLDSSAENAEVTYTFLALTSENTRLCPYGGIDFQMNTKYDRHYCSESLGGVISIEGTVSLSLTKQVSDSEIQQGQLLTYNISYINDGDYDLEYVWVWDDVPSDKVSIIADSISPTPTLTTDSRIAWQLGTIPIADTGTFTFTVLVDGNDDDLPDGDEVVNNALFGIIPGNFPQEPKPALTSTVTTIVQAPTIALSKTDGQETAQPGDLLTYTLLITNSSSSIATSDLVITDELPAGVTLAGTTSPKPPDDIQDDGQTLVWDSLDISADDTLEVTIPVAVDLDVPDGTILANTATAIYKNASGHHTFDAETDDDTTLVQAPVLTFTKTAEDLDGPPLVVSDTILYTLQVTNTGSYTAYNVTVTDDLPDQVTCTGVSGDGAPAGCDDPLVWEISSLAPDDSASLYIDVTINDGSEGQTIINTASLTGTNVPPIDPPPVCPDGSQPDPLTGVCPTTPEPLDTTLALTKTAEDVNGGYLVVGDEVLYTLQVTNIGTYTAYDVTVTDDLPEQVTCTDVSGDSPPAGCADPLEWYIESLTQDATATLYVTVTINDGTEGQNITNTASVTGTNVPIPPDDPTPVCPDGSYPDDQGQCPTTPVPTTTLGFTKMAEDVDGENLVVGDEILYTLQVTNTGVYTAYNVIVTDDLPDGVSYDSASADRGELAGSDPVVWTISELPAGSNNVATLLITVTINADAAGQSIINTGVITGSNVTDLPPNPQVCPDGKPPVDGICDNKPEGPSSAPGGGGVFLPIILKNY